MSPLNALMRFAGQAKLPVALNPFQTRQPTTTLGRLGKELNPLNPRNAAILAVTELVRAVAGKTLDKEGQERIEYMTLGMLPGIALNVLDAGAVGATPAKEQELIEQSRQYFAKQKLQSPTQAPKPQPGPRVDASTTQAQFYTRAPQQSPRVVPTTPIAPPQPTIGPTAIAAAQADLAAPTNVPLAEFYGAQEQLGGQLAQSGELQQRLQQTGMVSDALMEWAKANPALAYRELLKREKRVQPSVD